MRYLALFCCVSLFAVDPTSGKKLVFSDDFSGDKVDTTKWNISGKPEAFSIVKGGKEKDGKVLRITLVQSADMLQWNALDTKGKFEQVYGYFEASIRMPGYKGHTGGFRLSSVDEKTTPNGFLIWEGVGDDRLAPWARSNNDNGQHEYRSEGNGKQFLKAGEPSKKFNTYGILWTEKSYIWFVNGKQSFRADKAEIKKPMSLRLSHSVGEWERPNLNLKQLPDDIDIDWVKAWK
jgi:beta-glucanase (GH16 family)